jgi:hypothetical protein
MQLEGGSYSKFAQRKNGCSIFYSVAKLLLVRKTLGKELSLICPFAKE